jgi:hypothetical protein
MQHHRYLPLTLLNESIPPPYVSHRGRQTPHQLIDWLPHRYQPLQISTVADFVGREVWPGRILHCDKSNGENTACSARSPLEGSAALR